MARQSEILYCKRIRNDLKTRKLVDEIVSELPAASAARIKKRLHFIQMMGEDAPMTITSIIREHSEDESASKGHDFSRQSIEQLKQSGCRMTRKALGL